HLLVHDIRRLPFHLLEAAGVLEHTFIHRFTILRYIGLQIVATPITSRSVARRSANTPPMESPATKILSYPFSLRKSYASSTWDHHTWGLDWRRFSGGSACPS